MRQRTINLSFHGIGPPVRAFDPGEAEVWLDRNRFEAVLDAVTGRDDVRLTFDDGNASDLDIALPALSERGLTATFFVVAGRLGHHGFLDQTGVRTLAGEGMSIGCHGMRHRPWRQLDDHSLDEEIGDAKRRLEQVVERPVTEASCPFGSYDRRVLSWLRRHGYTRAYTSDSGTTREGDWLQARNTVRSSGAVGTIERILAGEESAWVILRRHTKQLAKRWR